VTVGINANLALDPVVSDLENLADASNSVPSSLGRLRRVQTLGVGYGLDESEGVAGIGVAAAHDLLTEIALYRRQAVVVPLLGFGISGSAGVGCGSIGGVTSGSGLGAEASLAQLGARIGGASKTSGSAARQASSWILVQPGLGLEPLSQSDLPISRAAHVDSASERPTKRMS